MSHHFHHHNRHSDPFAAARNPTGLYFGLGLFTLFGLVFVVIGVGTFMQGEATKRWIPVDGRVVSAEVSDHRDKDGHRMYRASVLYEYRYLGTDYKGSKIGSTDVSSSDYGAAQRTADRYRSGETVQVFVNPADPYAAVLQTGGGWFPLVFAVVGGLFGLVGIAGLVNAPRTIVEARARLQEFEQRQVAGAPSNGDPLGKL